MRASVDENLPVPFARMLSALAAVDRHEVVHVTDLVPRGASDLQLFQAIAQRGIGVHITQDHHHRKQVERESIAALGLIVFVLSKSWSDQMFWLKAAQLVRWWPLMVEQAERMRPPAAFRVPWKIQGKGRFEQIRNV